MANPWRWAAMAGCWCWLAGGTAAAAPGDGTRLGGAIARAQGMAAWRSQRAIAAHFALRRAGTTLMAGKLIYEIHRGRVRIELSGGPVLVFDGKRAWVSPAAAPVKRARFHLLTWPYFLAAPFKLRDPGTHLRSLGAAPLRGKHAAAARLTFRAGVGDTPDDWYVVYADPETGRLAAMGYIVTYGKKKRAAEKEPHAVVYEDEVQVGGAWLSRRWRFFRWRLDRGPYGKPLSEVRLRDLRFVTPDPAWFRRPAGAREDVLPPHPAR